MAKRNRPRRSPSKAKASKMTYRKRWLAARLKQLKKSKQPRGLARTLSRQQPKHKRPPKLTGKNGRPTAISHDPVQAWLDTHPITYTHDTKTFDAYLNYYYHRRPADNGR